MKIESISNGTTTAHIYRDLSPESPREWDNLGTMICRHTKYSMGDTNHGLDFTGCRSWKDDEKVIRAKFGRDAIMLPIYIYDHSGITIRTTPYSCTWDSGRVGTIVVDRETIRKEWNIKRITPKTKTKMLEILKGEVETYDQYLTGDVYGYKIVENGEETDSCWGYYGIDTVKDEVNSILFPNSKN